MSNPSKAKGTRFESDVVAYLRANGFPSVERRALAGTADRGDIGGVEGVVFECKATKSIDLAGAVDEAVVEAANDGADSLPVAIVKRRMRSTSDAYVVVPLWWFVRVLRVWVRFR